MPATRPSSTIKRDANLELIQRDIEELKEESKEHTRALFGKDGNPGLVGNFAAMVTNMAAIEKLFHNDLCHIQAKIDLMFTAEKTKDENSVKWTEILKDWIKPVIVAVITAAMVYFIVTNGIAG